MISKTFCVMPWVHLAVSTRGYFRLCCNQSFLPEDTERGGYLDRHYIHKEPVQDAWNSDSYKRTRIKMIEGEEIAPCSRCYREEKMGIKSARMNYNRDYLPSLKLSNIKSDGSCSLDSIKFIDVRLGNKCNLKCRMCNPYSSSNWISDERSTGVRKISEKDLQSLENIDWFENDFFWENLSSAMSNCDLIYFSGGEPGLFTEHQSKLFDKCIENKTASNIMLRYNTNLTIPLLSKFKKYWKHFRHIRINCSIDGVGKVNEYIRYPSKWDVIEKTLLSIYDSTQENLLFSMNPHTTVQMYNIFDLVNLFNYLKPLGLFPMLNILNQPAHYNIRVLNKNQKERVGNVLTDWYEENKNWLISHDRNGNYKKLPGMIKYIYEEDWSHLYPDFLREATLLDEIRNQKLEDYIPELKETK